MIRPCSCIVLAAAFQVIFGHAAQIQRQSTTKIPDHCLKPLPGVDFHKCCPLTPIFPDEDLIRCGIEIASTGKLKTPLRTKEPCHYSKCLMRNANLLLANQSVDYENLRAFVDNWASMNPRYSEDITGAKKLCTNVGKPSGPPICEQDRVVFCITSFVLWNCKILDLDGCQRLEENREECRPYFSTEAE